MRRCIFVVCFAVLIVACSGASLSVIQRLENLWGNIAYGAAEAAVQAIQKQTGLQLTLRDVPLDNFKVFIGRQHQLGVEIDGMHYDVSLSSELNVDQEVSALPDVPGKSGALVQGDWWQLRKQGGVPLPDITLAGPLELHLPRPLPLSMYLPHPADVGEAARVVLAPGATVRVRGLKALSLRRPVQLPRLPAQYLAEVYAHVKLGESEDSFRAAPGILYMARELQAAALNLSSGLGTVRGGLGAHTSQPLLSLDAEALSSTLTIMTAPEQPGAAAAKLRARRLKDGSLELSPREQPALEGSAATAKRQLQQSLVAVQQPAWAWPLAGVPLAQWVPYEGLLRGILASHPFDLRRVQQQGVALRLTRSSIKGVSFISFDMHVRGRGLKGGAAKGLLEEGRRAGGAEAAEEEVGEGEGEGEGAEGGPEEGVQRRQPEDARERAAKEVSEASNEQGPLEVWEVTVQLKEAAGGGGGWEYQPVNAKRKEAYQNTITLSQTAQDALLGNVTAATPLGFDHVDEGLARSAAADEEV